jgi:hypothetical protein
LGGIYIASSTSYPGFIHVASIGANTSFSYPGAAATFVGGVNDSLTAIGQYTDTIPYGAFASFIRTPEGKLAPLKYPGAKQTEALGINDCGVIVGSWVDAGGVTHGFYGKFDDFVSFDYPEGIQTPLQGVNDRGTLVGTG